MEQRECPKCGRNVDGYTDETENYKIIRCPKCRSTLEGIHKSCGGNLKETFQENPFGLGGSGAIECTKCNKLVEKFYG